MLITIYGVNIQEFTSLRSGHLIDHIHPPNRKVYDIEKKRV